MTTTTNAPLIIKRKKVVAGGGHHGGAWKVAYADFVTAMMAFFMLMWLLNATTEQQRKGLADYFSPDIPIARISGGGAGALNGQDAMSDMALHGRASGAAPWEQGEADAADDEASAVAALRDVEDILLGRGGESLVSDALLQHVTTRVTDEGLVIELFDRPDATLFDGSTGAPTDLGRELAALLARVFDRVENDVAVASYVRAYPAPMAEDRAWMLTMTRADVFRRLLQDDGLTRERIARATGHSDRDPAVADPMSIRNNRIEVTLLRSDL